MLDPNGNRTAVSSNAGTETYTLHALNRLTNVTYPGALSEAFVYDAAGKTDGTTVGFTVDATGQLISDSSGTTYTYDQAGNLTGTSDGESYTYDDYGRHASISAGGVTQTYGYDAANVRVTVDGQTQLWDRNGGLPTLISTSNGDNYVHTAGVSRDGDGWLLADAVGSVRTTVDNTGAATGSQSFTAFGEQLTGSGTFGFAGEQHDPTGLQHLRARQYNPALGRFTTIDPVQPGAPGTTGYNLYTYAGNNPTTWTDPTGQAVVLAEYHTLIAAAAVVALAAYLSTPAAQEAIEHTAESIAALFEEIIKFNFPDIDRPGEEEKPEPGPITDPFPPVLPNPPDPEVECPIEEEYYAAVQRIPQNATADWAVYERRVVAPHGPQAGLYGVTTAAGVTVNADGVDIGARTAIDAKFVRSPENTVFSDKKPAFLTRGIRDEFSRYGQILRDPCVPVDSLSVRTSDAVAVAFFQGLLATNGVPGTVTVVP